MRKGNQNQKLPYYGQANPGVSRGVQAQAAAMIQSLTKAPELSAFRLTIANSESVDQTATIFNGQTIAEITDAASGITKTNNTSSSVPTYANLILNVCTNPLLIAGFNYDADSKAQLSNAFDLVVGNLDGTNNKYPMGPAIALAVQNNQFIDDLLYINFPQVMDGFKGFGVSIETTEAIRLTFKVVSQFRYS